MNEVLKLLNPWWFGKEFDTGVKRQKYLSLLKKSLEHKRAVLVVGSRRVGKTFLLHQTIEMLLADKVEPRRILYVLGDHPYLSTFGLFQFVDELRREFGLDRNQKLYLFFDEVQHIQDWERQAKALIDTENVKLFLSGSASAKILLQGNFLTGRLEKIEVWPLDFIEFLRFRPGGNKISETEEYKFETYLKQYLKIGGYPEYVLHQDNAYFADLISNVLQKDIVSIYGLRNPDLLRDLFLLVADRHGSQTSYAKLGNILSLKSDTIKEYLFYLKNTFLTGEVARFASSRAKRVYAAKKFYVTDAGMLFNLLGKVNYGAAFEGMVYRYLSESGKLAGFYYENGQEVDFVVKNGGRQLLWEAKYEWKDDERKIKGYMQAAQALETKEVWIVTTKTQEVLKENGVTVKCVNWQEALSR